MAKTLLRSGNLDDLLALGENGQSVYASALQLRETLRRKKQQKIADYLAIPQPNDAGDRIDWYAPFSGKVKSWMAASDSERASALSQLENCQTTLRELSQQAQSADKAALRLFGALLSKAFQFPDKNYVYFVGGKPVITFWGFVDLDKKARGDVLDCLRESLQAPPDPVPPALPVYDDVPVPAAPTIAPPEDKPAVAEQPAIAPADTVTPPARRTWRHLLWLLPLLIAVAAAALLNRTAPEKAVGQPENERDIPPAAAKAPSAAVAPPAPPAAEPAPVPHAEPVPPPAAAEAEKPAQPESEAPVPEAAIPPADRGDELVMPPDDVKIGSTAFLNGGWRVTLEVKNLPTGKPPSLKYQIKNGKGTARILQADGISCKADIAAGLMSSGNLVINSRYTARCSDGSRYKMPQLVCKATAGAASCEARYGETVFPMMITRESK